MKQLSIFIEEFKQIADTYEDNEDLLNKICELESAISMRMSVYVNKPHPDAISKCPNLTAVITATNFFGLGSDNATLLLDTNAIIEEK